LVTVKARPYEPWWNFLAYDPAWNWKYWVREMRRQSRWEFWWLGSDSCPATFLPDIEPLHMQ
jgi:hypothetical protein